MTALQENIILQHTTLLIIKIRDIYGLSMRKAMDTVYNSDTFKILCDTQTGEYREGSLAILDDLLGELRTGKVPEEY